MSGHRGERGTNGPQGLGEPRLSPRIVKARVKQARAVELRAQGLPWEEVAAGAGYRSAAAAIKAADAILRTMPSIDDRERWRAQESARLTGAYMALLPKVVAGDEYAIRTMVAVSARLSKLLGLDAPEEIILGGSGEPIRVEVTETLDPAGMELARSLRERVAEQLALRSGDVHEGEAEEEHDAAE